ncbi:hypothetical protein Lepto7376_1480 [[Leptolyngbya] sp. PCC 7376]|uniref:DUF732 domain-containing protein n=1 Tax=[Leptolyngbya] sp. PCC 7376 TaxID=111781 RepID=UPI00029EC92F|nr:DUF732 domain-containing protein [[Leptolyngbya] sp. PCC 7376]AFY37823.1 hypothetical protein Lepto7376_1480 [[Leptolyngbya] sp. PCC 7376]
MFKAILQASLRLKVVTLFALIAPLGLGLVGCGEVEVEEEVNNATEQVETSTSEAPPAAEEEEIEEDVASDAATEQFTFVVTNQTEDDLIAIQASEDEEVWGDFDLGGQAIAPGESLTLAWDESTNDSSCEWLLQGVFTDGSVVGPKWFDFCEEVELVFYSEGEDEAAGGGSAADFLSTEAAFVETIDDSGIQLLAAEVSDPEKVAIAREFCTSMDMGNSVDDFFETVASDEPFLSMSDEELELVGGYLGLLITAAADSYCAEYGDIVANWMDS